MADDTAQSSVSTPSIRVFGGVGVDVDGEPVSIGGPRQRRLLALLAARAGSVVDIDWLAEYLWAEDERPEATAPALRTYVSRLRQSLPEAAQGWIQTESSGYRLDAPDEAIETRRFAALRAEATLARERQDPLAAQELLDEALALWRGDPFRELEDLDWASADIAQLNLDRLEMLEERWETALALGRHTQITGELASFTGEHGLRDRAARQYALALHRSGRTPEALRVLENHRRTVVDQTGLDPSPAVAELERALLAGDPSLDVDTGGRPLRGYRLIEEAGVGAFAIVWRGIQPSVGREVAIKQIRSELASQPDFIRRFEAEAHLVARIEHPHIVPLIDFWRDPDSAYLVMRWLRGGTLERRLDDGPLTVAETLVLARQIGDALSAAHAQGVIHRDVKAGNILFDEAGNAFLGDFGIALEASESAGPEAALSSGSPAYSSPEQIRRERLGPEADIFSLGVVLFECLTGALPFGAMSMRDLVDRQLNEPYPPLSELRSDVPTSISAAVAKATAKASSDRFATVAQFLDALEPAAAEPATTAPVGSEATNPYKGLRAFDDGDTDEFFGRERLVSELVARFEGNSIRSRCVAVVGPSGSGKSSVVRAGLLPAIRAGRVEGSSAWFTASMLPGSDPFESLEAALLRIAVNPPPTLLEQLRSGNRGILRSIRRCLGSDGDRVVLVIDQFEEVFTGTDGETAHAFLDALAVAVAEPTSPLRLVLTLRADYYDRPLGHPTFARVLKETAVDVTPLAPDELERSMVEPALRQGLHFEPGLVARISADTIGQPAPLPLLQYALSELFEQRDDRQLTTAAYDSMGGLSGALTTRAEVIHAVADADQRAALRRLFGRMTNATEESADLRRRVPLADLVDDPSTDWVMDQLGAARLVTFDRDVTTREPTIEVAHEALLREWPRLVAWLGEDRETLRAVDAIGAASSTWDAEGRAESDLYRGARLETAVGLASTVADRLRPLDKDFVQASRAAAETERHTEQRRVRRLRRLVAALGAALVVALVAGGLALRAQQRADDEAEAADASAQEAELATIISRSAALIEDEPEVALLLALEAHRRDPGPETEQAVFTALGSSPIANRVTSVPVYFGPSEDCGFVNVADGLEFGVLEGQLAIRDPLTGAVTTHGAAPVPCLAWVGDPLLNRRRVESTDGLRAWFGPFEGALDVSVEFEQPTFALIKPMLPTNLEFFGALVDGVPTILVLDQTTGAVIATHVVSEADGPSDDLGARNADGSLVAIGFEVPSSNGVEGLTLIFDAVTGEEVRRVSTASPLVSIEFDDAAGELIGGGRDGSLFTIDLSTGQTSAVVSASTTGLLDIGIRPDGLITHVSPGQAELIDRRLGPIGKAVELRDLLNAIVRPDGLVQAIGSDLQVEVIDLEGTALIERTFDVSPVSQVVISDGLAAFVDVGTDEVEVINLTSGERAALTLTTPDGSGFAARAVFPDAGGVWGLSLDAIGRWEGGRMVERLDFEGRMVWFDEAGQFATRIELRRNGDAVAQLVDLTPGGLAVRFSIGVDDVRAALPTPDGGMVTVDGDGLLRTFGPDSSLLDEIETGLTDAAAMAIDPSLGRLAMGGNGVVLVDLATGTVTRLPQVNRVANLAIARSGELLVIGGADGTVRLWDMQLGESAGLAWRGSGPMVLNVPDVDFSAQATWFASSGKLLEIPLDPQEWVERACEVVNRELTPDEWERFVPGDVAQRSACS